MDTFAIRKAVGNIPDTVGVSEKHQVVMQVMGALRPYPIPSQRNAQYVSHQVVDRHAHEKLV